MRYKIRILWRAVLIIQVLLICIRLIFFLIMGDRKDIIFNGVEPWTKNHTPAKLVANLSERVTFKQVKAITHNWIEDNHNMSLFRNETATQKGNSSIQIHTDVVPQAGERKEHKVEYVVRTRKPVDKISWKCRDLVYPDQSEVTERWQPVDGETTFVFSAYFIERGRKIVILGAKTMLPQSYFCLSWKKLNGKYVADQLRASARQLPEGHKLRFAATFFECSPGLYSDAPSFVSLVTKRCESPSNMLKVQLTTRPENFSRRFTVCLSPLNTNYSRAYELVEWIELNRILGAEKFLIYNNSSADNVACVLDFYRKQGLVEVIQWQLPVDVRTFNGTKLPEIHYYGQSIALQDCLYRNKVDSEFVVNIDLDEFIIPRGNNTYNWNDILRQVTINSGAYIVRNTFFRKEWENVYFEKRESVDKYGLVTLKTLHREENIFKAKRRSKYFARTEFARQVAIHDVIYLPSKNIAQVVPVETALLHHYRDWENAFQLPAEKVYDDTIPTKYGKTLLNNVEKIWSKLLNVNMNIPVD